MTRAAAAPERAAAAAEALAEASLGDTSKQGLVFSGLGGLKKLQRPHMISPTGASYKNSSVAWFENYGLKAVLPVYSRVLVRVRV